MAFPHGGASIIWRDGEGPHRPTKEQIRDYMKHFEDIELHRFDTVAHLIGDIALAYAPNSDKITVVVGMPVEADGFRYQVATAAATDHHVTTEGGVKLYVLRGSRGYNVKAFGAIGDDVSDDTVALAKWIVACQDHAGYAPFGVYKHTGLTFLPQYSYNISGDAYDGHAIGGTVLHNTDVSGGHSITIDNTPWAGNYDSQIRFTNLTIKGNVASGNGFNVDQTMVFLENVWITGNGGHGYFAQRCYSSSFRQVSFSNNYKNGFRSNRALNAVHFDHCLFNGNAMLTGYAGCYLHGASGEDRNFAVTFSVCDFTGNGATLGGGDVAYGLLMQNSSGVSVNGCYGENNRTYNIYADGTVSNLSVREGFWQDCHVYIVGVYGLIFENNHIINVSAATTLTIDCGMPNDRYPHRIFGTQFSGTVTKTLTGGATEVEHFNHIAAPTAGTWLVGDKVWNSNIQNGGGILGWVCTVAGSPGTWLPMGQVPYVYANHGDAATTLTVGASFTTNFWRSPITADRAVTLSTSGAFSGAKFRITRVAGAAGAFDLNVGTGPLKALAAGEWCDVEYDGGAWLVSAFGTL